MIDESMLKHANKRMAFFIVVILSLCFWIGVIGFFSYL